MNLESSSYQFANIQLNTELGELKSVSGEVQRLTPINRKLLNYLVCHAERVVTRAELFDAIWPNQVLSDDVLTRAISDIRGQLAALNSEMKFIETLPKRGYRWVHIDAQTPTRTIDEEQKQESPEPLLPPLKTKQRVVLQAVSYCALALLVAVGVVWYLSKPRIDQIPVAVLPVISVSPALQPLSQQAFDGVVRLLRKYPNLQLVARSAVDARPQLSYPYFAREFGAVWVLDSRITQVESGLTFEINLIDARSGLESRSLVLEGANWEVIEVKLQSFLDDGWLDSTRY